MKSQFVFLKKVSQRLSHLYDALKEYFAKADNPPQSVKKFFNCKLSKCYLIAIEAFASSLESTTLDIESRKQLEAVKNMNNMNKYEQIEM